MITNLQQAKDFIELLPDLQNDEVYFLTLFARNKVDKQEAKSLGLSRCSTVAKEICRDKASIIKKLYGFDRDERAFLTNEGVPIPKKFLIPYITIHTVSPIKAYIEFNKAFQLYLTEPFLKGEKPNSNTYDRIKKASSLLVDCHQHAWSTKKFIDVDYDGDKKEPALDLFESRLQENNIKWETVETNGGYHYLLHRDTVKMNYTLILEECNKQLGDTDNIFELNNNGALPMPGCLQYGFEVKLL